MKECLYCKKEFSPKKDTAKYCSDSCRVMWNRKNKRNKLALSSKVDESKLDILIRKVDAIESRINFTPPAPASFDAPPSNRFLMDEVGVWPNANNKPKLIRSFENYRELRIDCGSAEDWAELKQEILSATHLSEKQKILLTT